MPTLLLTLVLTLIALTSCKNEPLAVRSIDADTLSHSVQLVPCVYNTPRWVAIQDASGGWKQVAMTETDGTFRLQFTGDRLGVAYLTVTSTSNGTALSILYATTAELQALDDKLTMQCGIESSEFANLTGSVAGVGATDLVAIASGPSRGFARAQSGNAFGLSYRPLLFLDLIAARYPNFATQSSGPAVMDKLIVRRAVAPFGDQDPKCCTLNVLDFSVAGAVSPATATVTIVGLGADSATVETALRTTTDSSAAFAIGTPSPESMRVFYGVPAASLIAADLHQLSVYTHDRWAIAFFHSMQDRTVTLGPAVSVPTIATLATTPSLRLEARLARQSEYDRWASISYTQAWGNGEDTNRTVTITETTGHAGSGPYDLVIPNLSGVAGFNSAWGLAPGFRTGWMVVATGGTFLSGYQPASEGASVVVGRVTGVF